MTIKCRKILFLSIVVIVAFTRCTKDEPLSNQEEDPVDMGEPNYCDSIDQSTYQIETIIDNRPPYYIYPARSDTSNFYYEEDRLVRIIRNDYQWNINYHGDRITSLTGFKMSDPFNVKVKKVEYDKKCNILNNEVNHHPENLTWEEGNLIHAKYFSSNGEPYIEYFYKYDDNFNYRKLDPRDILRFGYINKNNITQVSHIEQRGTHPYDCNPCFHKYTYNADGLPTFIEYSWGGSKEIIYR